MFLFLLRVLTTANFPRRMMDLDDSGRWSNAGNVTMSANIKWENLVEILSILEVPSKLPMITFFLRSATPVVPNDESGDVGVVVPKPNPSPDTETPTPSRLPSVCLASYTIPPSSKLSITTLLANKGWKDIFERDHTLRFFAGPDILRSLVSKQESPGLGGKASQPGRALWYQMSLPHTWSSGLYSNPSHFEWELKGFLLRGVGGSLVLGGSNTTHKGSLFAAVARMETISEGQVVCF